VNEWKLYRHKTAEAEHRKWNNCVVWAREGEGLVDWEPLGAPGDSTVVCMDNVVEVRFPRNWAGFGSEADDEALPSPERCQKVDPFPRQTFLKLYEEVDSD
jgi:hypothetical protein